MWADELAQKINQGKKRKFFVSTMVTPSGPIHLGNLKEVMVGYLISQALQKRGNQVSFNFFADNFDHLRRRYPFLSKEYEKYVGVPLSEIPDLEGCHESYDKHFLQPFFKALDILNIKPNIRFIDRLYKEGVFADLIGQALENRDKIAEIISKISGRRVLKDWSPFMPICQKCKKMTTTKVIESKPKDKRVVYQCECGHRGEVDFSKGGGKLVWRVHWPACWKIFGVDIEGLGKDLATKGGAYDTARVIVKEVFNGTPPFPIPYEWVYAKGSGKMASSTGVGFTPLEILEVLPPEILIYFYQRTKPNKHLFFDIKETIPNLWSEYGGLSGIPFQHLVMALQSSQNLEGVLESLKRTGYGEKITKDESKIKKELAYIKNWLKKYAPQEYKFEITKKLPDVKLTTKQKAFLSNILKTIVSNELDGEKLHQKIHQIRKELDISPREAFASIYLVFLGKDSGPQAGWFLAGLNKKFVIKRLQEAIK